MWRSAGSPEFTKDDGSEAHDDEEMYSRGRRGAPAKGVGRETGARVQIPPSPFEVIFLKLLQKVLDAAKK